MSDTLPRPIHEITRQLELGADYVEPYGWHKGKLESEFAPQRKNDAANPT